MSVKYFGYKTSETTVEPISFNRYQVRYMKSSTFELCLLTVSSFLLLYPSFLRAKPLKILVWVQIWLSVFNSSNDTKLICNLPVPLNKASSIPVFLYGEASVPPGINQTFSRIGSYKIGIYLQLRRLAFHKHSSCRDLHSCRAPQSFEGLSSFVYILMSSWCCQPTRT